MSLEEYGDMQLQQLQDREAAAAQREMEGEGATRRYNNPFEVLLK
jgi:hypothetical protein